ncbi:MAG: hypothetical protein DA407_09245 [Bacteroidetes bacterium]|nr:MAG: hypothetical protein DA407_09245 [Bacteroidota bacterium]
MNFQFKLRNGKKSTTIISELRLGSNVRIRLSTPYAIPYQSIKFWDTKRQLIKIPNDILEADNINKKLNDIRLKVYSEFSDLEIKSANNIEELKEKLRIIVKPNNNVELIPKESQKNNLVIEYYQWYIDFYKKHMSPSTGKIFSKSTLRTYSNALRFIRDYLNEKGVKNFSFDDITKDFYYDFIEYGENLGYSKNYLGSMMQKLKTVIRSAYDEEIHQNREFKKGYFKKFREEINHPYLTEVEILKLYELKIENQYLDNIRDTFIIACYTGLRIGDLMNFLKNPKIESFNGRKHIHIIQMKTRKPVFIPLKQIILKILEKRNGSFPYYIHVNLINKNIKPLLKLCEITEMYEIEKTIGGQRTTIKKPKYDLISCHSARRSFCTNAYNNGVPLQDIMAISGHSSEEMVLRYIKASAKEKAKRASDHAFFS